MNENCHFSHCKCPFLPTNMGQDAPPLVNYFHATTLYNYLKLVVKYKAMVTTFLTQVVVIVMLVLTIMGQNYNISTNIL